MVVAVPPIAVLGHVLVDVPIVPFHNVGHLAESRFLCELSESFVRAAPCVSTPDPAARPENESTPPCRSGRSAGDLSDTSGHAFHLSARGRT